MLSKRYSASSLTESIVVVSPFDVSLAAILGLFKLPVTEGCGGGGDVIPGVLISPAKVEKARTITKIDAAQSCRKLLIVSPDR
jgi:hypothetical protein